MSENTVFNSIMTGLNELIEDYCDTKTADERLAHGSDQSISISEMAKKYNITEKDLENAPNIEIE